VHVAARLRVRPAASGAAATARAAAALAALRCRRELRAGRAGEEPPSVAVLPPAYCTPPSVCSRGWRARYGQLLPCARLVTNQPGLTGAHSSPARPPSLLGSLWRSFLLASCAGAVCGKHALSVDARVVAASAFASTRWRRCGRRP
jgi:hypothetical protein